MPGLVCTPSSWVAWGKIYSTATILMSSPMEGSGTTRIVILPLMYGACNKQQAPEVPEVGEFVPIIMTRQALLCLISWLDSILAFCRLQFHRVIRRAGDAISGRSPSRTVQVLSQGQLSRRQALYYNDS